ncbi:MAG: hypothetical protein MI864_25210 [Pseudomonadales bacterium]|nr:hypothetical protein [Pseudomonadales bacterium]
MSLITRLLCRQAVFILLLLSFDTGAAEFEWSGFASIAGGKTLDQDTSYIVAPDTGSTYTDELNFAPETLAGLQVQTQFTEKARATLLLMAKGGNDFDANVEWAYLSYDLTNELTLNAGRYRLPLYYYSDFLDVGYAYPWIRPPVDVYWVPVTSIEGLNLYYNRYLSDIQFSTQLWYGTHDLESDTGPDVSLRNATGINITFQYRGASLRFGQERVDVSLGFDTFKVENRAEFSFLAFMVDHKNFIWNSEYTYTVVKNLASSEDGETTTWYASLGYRIAKFTPHFTHSFREGAGNVNPASNLTSKTNTLGVAWYFHRNTVLKLEYSQSDLEQKSTGDSRDIEIISTAIDILF